MKIYLAPSFVRAYKTLVKQNPSSIKTIKAEIEHFKQNPLDPSLETHRLKGKRSREFSFAVEKDLRLIFQKVKGGILLVDIGTHKQVY